MDQYQFPFPNKESSMEILKKDPCFGKIPPHQVEAVFEDAWSTGEAEAKKFLEDHCYQEGFSMVDILRGLGFSVIREDVDYVMGKTRYFCEYFPKKKQIRVYGKSVGLWAESNLVEPEQGENIILSHEFFHCLEAGELGWISRRCLVPMLKLGSLTLGKTGIAALSEVAANAFANQYYRAYSSYLKEHKKEQEE